MCVGKFKPKNTCSKNYATCVEYQGTIPEISSLSEEDCLDMEQITEDIYSLIEEIKEDSDLENLRDGCITYPSGEIKVNTALENIQTFICTQQTSIEALTERVSTLELQVQQLQENQCP